MELFLIPVSSTSENIANEQVHKKKLLWETLDSKQIPKV